MNSVPLLGQHVGSGRLGTRSLTILVGFAFLQLERFLVQGELVLNVSLKSLHNEMQNAGKFLLGRLHHVNDLCGEVAVICDHAASVHVRALVGLAEGNWYVGPRLVVFGVGEGLVGAEGRQDRIVEDQIEVEFVRVEGRQLVFVCRKRLLHLVLLKVE